MLSATVLNDAMLSIVMLNNVMLITIMLGNVMLSVVMVSVLCNIMIQCLCAHLQQCALLKKRSSLPVKFRKDFMALVSSFCLSL